MLKEKVAQSELNGKSSMLEKYDHYVAVDWSMRIMAIAHMTTHRKVPQVFERPTNLKEGSRRDRFSRFVGQMNGSHKGGRRYKMTVAFFVSRQRVLLNFALGRILK